MEPATILGTGLVAVSALAYVYPKAAAYLSDKKAGSLPHDHVKALIDFFTAKQCKRGVDASVTVGKLLYEECTDHIDGNEPTPVKNNLP